MNAVPDSHSPNKKKGGGSTQASKAASSKVPPLLASPWQIQLAKVLAALSKVLLNKRILKAVLGAGRF